jgi:ATP-dependent RNA helicase DHX57
MPKNAHPPRGGSKKSAPPPQPDDGLDIVFSNAKGEPKKRGKGTSTPTPAPESSAAGKGKGKEAAEPPTDDAPKKPDTRTLIGGASWTGKLPVNMFNEHCQKQKWDKPEYTMVSAHAVSH